MHVRIFSLYAVSISVLLFAQPSNAANHPAVQPGQEFPGPMLQIHSPSSEGWVGMSSNATQMVFAKSGSDSDESYIAAVMIFHLPEFANPEAFTDFIKQAAEKDSPPERFDIIEITAVYSEERAYPCVKYHAIAKD